jgi:hypothetical protein
MNLNIAGFYTITRANTRLIDTTLTGFYISDEGLARASSSGTHYVIIPIRPHTKDG